MPQNPPQRRSLVRAIALRLLVYGALIVGVVGYVVGLPSVAWQVQPTAAVERVASSGPGWPHVRGARYDAHAPDTDLADAWPAQGPPVLWMREIGVGYSGLIAVGGRVFTQAQSGVGQVVLALEAATGQTLWQHRYGWPYEPGGMYPGPRATPTYADGRVYYAAPNGEVGCLRAEDGHLLWSVPVKERFGGRGSDFGYACSPLVEDGKVVLPVGGPTASLVALDARTGATVWTAGDQPASYCGALPIGVGGRRQVVAFLQNELAGFDLTTGEPLWRRSLSRGYDEHAAWPLYREPYLRTMLPFRSGSDLYRLDEVASAAKGIPELRPLRHDMKMSNDVASSVLEGACVYGFDLREAQTSPHRASRGEFRAIDFLSGQIHWSSDRPGHASIAVADGKLFLLNDQGEVVLLRATPEQYEELGRAEVFAGEICWTAPSLDQGRLYLRSPTRAACLYVGKAENLSRSLRAQATPTSALPKLRRLDLGWLVGAEREFPLELPDGNELSRWYLFSLGVLAGAAILAAIVALALRRAAADRRRRSAVAMFAGAVFVGGLAATPLGNRVSEQFVFTWPLSLFLLHQLALASVLRSSGSEQRPRVTWFGPAASVLFVIGCLVYFDLTRRLSLGPGWYFLATLALAWPLAVPAARRLRTAGLCASVVWTVAAFSVYFWIAGSVILWRRL